jgi:hypothetical protein
MDTGIRLRQIIRHPLYFMLAKKNIDTLHPKGGRLMLVKREQRLSSTYPLWTSLETLLMGLTLEMGALLLVHIEYKTATTMGPLWPHGFLSRPTNTSLTARLFESK